METSMSVEAQGQMPRSLQFTGTGSSYFQIWIVNLFLTLITLGIYSAWAKVRRLQYFYRNTLLAGSSFDYHGDPKAILKGRIIALVLFAVYQYALDIDPIIGGGLLILLAVIFPWLLMCSFRFRLYNSSYRGLRFSFHGSLSGAYQAFLLWPLATFGTLYLLGPMWHQRLKAYQHGHARYGSAPFGFHASVKSFYKIYLIALMLLFLVLVAVLFIAGAYMGYTLTQLRHQPSLDVAIKAIALFFVAYLLVALVVWSYVRGRVHNLVWNNTTLGAHRFRSTVSARKLIFIFVTNFLAILITLGFYRPFAQVRLAKYVISNMTFISVGNLDDFVAGEQQKIGATGEETADMFDVDIAL